MQQTCASSKRETHRGRVCHFTVRFSCEIQVPEARAFYCFQIAMDFSHSETRSLLIEQYIEAPEKKVFNAIHTMPAIEQRPSGPFSG